jgi:DNA-binding protein YbaB
LTNQDIKRRKDIKQMEVRLRQLESEAERFTLDSNYGQGRVESIMTCVQQIFNLLDCEENAELLGTQGVTESNMMTYMGIVE